MVASGGTVDAGPDGRPGTLRRIWTPSDMILGVVATTLGSLLVVGAIGVVLVFVGSEASRRVGGAVAAIALEAVLGLWVVIRAAQRGLRPADLGFVMPRSWAPLWIALGGSYAALIGYAMALQGLESFGIDTSRFNQGNPLPVDASDGGTVLLLLGVAVVGLAPLCEELFFRGLIYRGLRGFWTVTPALLLSGFLFSAFHLNPSVMLPFTVIGVLFAWSTEASGSIYTSIAAHGAVNSLSFVLTATMGVGA